MCLKCFLSYKKRLFPAELLQQALLVPVNDENGVDPTKRFHCPAELKLPTRPSETSGQNGGNSQISQSPVSTVNSVIASVCLPSLRRRCPEVAPSGLSSPCLLFCLLDCSLQGKYWNSFFFCPFVSAVFNFPLSTTRASSAQPQGTLTLFYGTMLPDSKTENNDLSWGH